MAYLTAERNTPERIGHVLAFPAAADIYAGALVAVNSDGAAIPASASSGTVAGRAENTAAAGERVSVRIGCFAFDGDNITLADTGKTVYVVDDHTVALTGTVKAGTVYGVDEEGVWVDIRPAAAAAAAAE